MASVQGKKSLQTTGGMPKTLHKKALKAIARITHIDLTSAIRTTRHNPILDSEIHIEEELINLKESLESYQTAAATLQQYPKIHEHMIQERRVILKHCMGLTIRMMYGKKLPRPYNKDEIEYAVTKMVRLIVDDAHRMGKRIDAEIMQIFRPFLTTRQRVMLHEWGMDMVVKASQLPRMYQLVRPLAGGSLGRRSVGV